MTTPSALHGDSRADAFTAGVAALGFAILAHAAYVVLIAPPGHVWWLLVAGALVTSRFTLRLPGADISFSLSALLVFIAMILYGADVAALVFAADLIPASFRFDRRSPLYLRRILFNGASAAITAWLPAILFFHWSKAEPGALGTSLPNLLLPYTAAAVLYSCSNTGLTSIVVALHQRIPMFPLWRQNARWVWVEHAWCAAAALAIVWYVPQLTVNTTILIGIGLVLAYASIRTYLAKVEEATTCLEELNRLYLSTIHTLAMAIDAKDQETHGHVWRVQKLALQLAAALHVTDEKTLKGLEAAAVLHDVGKLAIPNEILNKPDRLTHDEFETMKTHATVGADILAAIDFPVPLVPFVRHHHEAWDGSGYPDGLRGTDIPLGARILAVADCFDALTSDRPYRRRLSVDAALEIMAEQSGTKFDPRIVAQLIELQAPARTAAPAAVASLPAFVS